MVIVIAIGVNKHECVQTQQMSIQPKLAPEEVRLAIIDALRDCNRRVIARSDGTSRNYLDHWEIKADTLFEDLAEDLEEYELYLKPKQQVGDPQKYQYVLYYPKIDDFPELLIHATLSSRGEPPRVKIAVHPHNTGYAPLERIPITPQKNENDKNSTNN